MIMVKIMAQGMVMLHQRRIRLIVPLFIFALSSFTSFLSRWVSWLPMRSEMTMASSLSTEPLISEI